MTLIQKYNQLVKTQYKVHTKDKERYRKEREEFYDMVEELSLPENDGYVMSIPSTITFSGKDEELRFKTLPRESYAYGVKHE